MSNPIQNAFENPEFTEYHKSWNSLAAQVVMNELDSRKGINIYCFDTDIQEEIFEELSRLIKESFDQWDGDNEEDKNTKEPEYVYHYHAMRQLRFGDIHHIDGILTLSKPVSGDWEQYLDIKQQIAQHAENGERIQGLIICSLSLLSHNPIS